jgi:S-adenosylmethionine hydrolase
MYLFFSLKYYPDILISETKYIFISVDNIIPYIILKKKKKKKIVKISNTDFNWEKKENTASLASKQQITI